MHLNHGRNKAFKKKIQVHRAEKLSKNCLNLAEFLEYTYLAVFGWFLGPMYSDLFFGLLRWNRGSNALLLSTKKPTFRTTSILTFKGLKGGLDPPGPALPLISGISSFFRSSLYIKRTQKTHDYFLTSVSLILPAHFFSGTRSGLSKYIFFNCFKDNCSSLV